MLQLLLQYDGVTGKLAWKNRPHDKRFRRAGQEALSCISSEGYKVGTIAGCGGVKAHRVAWKMFYGTEPDCIDHINGDRADNRINNLRSVSNAENARNMGVAKNNTSGHNGVYWYPRYKKWMVSLGVGGARKTIGYFADKADAVAARKAADERFGYSTWRDR